ncbi:nuclear transport factor 2 family protein [Arthrobacter sp. NyZ413]|uniref:nuclear transport factor 2 family protein n=1 Tax=Arthrobacter sp. NyZ413 TaxID=3144669 RepID=UPI003BF8BACF
MTTDVQQTPLPSWGRTNGFVAFGDTQAALDDSAVADRLRILDALDRYAWSYDERNIPALENGFTEDAVWEGSVAGEFAIDPIKGRRQISEWLQGHMAAQRDQRRHNILNVVFVSQEERTAELIAYLLLTSASAGKVDVVTTGFYRVNFAKSDTGAWEIEYMFGGFDAPF